MPSTNPNSVEIATRHAVHLESAKTQDVKELASFLQDLDSEVRKRLSGREITAFTRARLERLLSRVDGDIRAVMGEHNAALRQMTLDLGDYEAGFEQRALGEVLVNVDTAAPTSAQIQSAILNNPLNVPGPAGGKLMEGFLDSLTDTETARLTGAIRSGFAQGETTGQILQRVRGTRARGFTDGILNITRRNAEAVTRTSLQHAATQAREATWARNSDIVRGVEWVSTLDSRTSPTCQSLDGRRFPSDKGPRPPIHFQSCLAGTKIHTKRGMVPIEDVRVGDMVKTHNHRWKRVYTVMSRDYEGPARNLINDLGCSVSLTNEHPVLTLNKGWVKAGEINAGDVSFYDVEQLDGLNRVRESALVPQSILSDAHNIVTGLTQELVSYGIFSTSAGVSSSVNLNNGVIDKKVGVVSENGRLGGVSDTDALQYSGKQRLVLGRVIPEGVLDGLPDSPDSSFVSGGVSLGHPLGILGKLMGVLFWVFSSPMVFSGLRLNILHIISNRLALAFDRYAVLFNPKIQAAGSNAVFPLYPPDALPVAEMLGFDEASNVAGVHKSSPQWLASTFTTIEEYHYSGHVYNLAVEDDETYVAEGVVVHNCRSTVVARLDGRFASLEEGATRNARDPSTGQIERVPAKETYYGWLKRQPAEFQQSVLGPTRAKLLREGGLSAQRFSELQLDKQFQPRTLSELKELEPVAFSRADVDV